MLSFTLGAMFALLALRAVSEPVGDPDVWWVAAVGRDVVFRGHVPRVNGYSTMDAGVPWVMHEWLLAAPYALGLSRYGPGFFAALGVLSGALTLGGVLACTAGRARHLASGAWLTLGVILGCRESLVSPRPGYLGLSLAAWAVFLAFRPVFTPLHALLSVALTLLWTNVHGSFPLALGLLALGALDARDRSPLRLGALVAALLATFANPYGLRLHGLVARYLLGGDPLIALIHHNISEFAPLWHFQGPFVNPQNLLVLTLLTALSVRALRGVDRVRGLCALSVIALGALHARHMMLAIVVGASVLTPALDEVLDGLLDPPTPAVFKRFRSSRALAPGILLSAFALWAIGRHRSFGDWISPRLGGPEIVALASKLKRPLRVYAPFESSGLLLWLSAPSGLRVLSDPRNDCFRERTLALGFALQEASLNDRQRARAMEASDTEGVLVPDEHPVGRWISSAQNYRLQARRGRWGLWLRVPEGDRAHRSRD